MAKHKIFCIGLSRSGTTSLNRSLYQLGFKSRHFPFQLYDDINSSIVANADAFSDTPIPMIYQELDKLYPNSKFIMTKRNKAAWLKSMKWMLEEGKAKWWWSYQVHEYHQKFYGTNKFSAKILSEKYDLYHQEVDEYFKNRSEDLLMLDLDQGVNMKQLCSFLNIPEREIEFPRSNSKRSVSALRKFAYSLYSSLFFLPITYEKIKSASDRSLTSTVK